MLLPEKHMDINRSPIVIAGILLKYLLKYRVVKTDSLLGHAQAQVGDEIGEEFLSALTLLYALGKIAYLQHNDNITLIENEA